MKKMMLFSSLIVSAILFNLSCQKTKINPNPNNETAEAFDFRTDAKFNELFKSNAIDQTAQLRIDNSKIIEIANIQDEEVRKLAISTLDTDEKIDFWNYVIEYHINGDNYTNYQKILIRSLKAATVNNAFFNNENLRTIFSSCFIQPIKTQLNNAGISDAKMSAAFTDGRLIYIEPTAQKPGPTQQKLKCDCSSSSIFSMCSNCKATDNCTETTNCGFLFAYPCNGLCPKYVPANFNF